MHGTGMKRYIYKKNIDSENGPARKTISSTTQWDSGST